MAWSQDDDAADEPVPYTGEDLYDTDVTTARPPVQYVPATGPIEEPRTWQRLPQLVFGLAAAVALVAVGGVAIALTSATNSTDATDPPSTAVVGETAERRTAAAKPPRGDRHRHQRAVTATASAATHHHRRAGDDDVRHHDAADDHHHDHDHDNHDHHDDDHHHDDDYHHADDDHHNHDRDNDTDDDDLHQRAVRAGADSDSGAAEPGSALPLSQTPGGGQRPMINAMAVMMRNSLSADRPVIFSDRVSKRS